MHNITWNTIWERPQIRESSNTIDRDKLFLGEVIPWAWSFSLTGNPALKFLDDFYMDRVFLSVTGLDADRGATTLETDEALVCHKMLEDSKQVIVVTDSSKLGGVSPALICRTNEIHTFITNTGASEEMLAPRLNGREFNWFAHSGDQEEHRIGMWLGLQSQPKPTVSAEVPRF